MLYLMIKKEDYFVVDVPGYEEVKIRIIDCNKGTVKLGIDFPKPMGVWRGKLWERIKGEREINRIWNSDRPTLKLKREA